MDGWMDGGEWMDGGGWKDVQIYGWIEKWREGRRKREGR